MVISGFLLLSALYVSSVSSCLATLYGTPRVLQSIAAENVLPAFSFLAEGVRRESSNAVASVKKKAMEF